MKNLNELIKQAAQVAGDTDSVEFNEALAEIQKAIGSEDGGFAANYFSSSHIKWMYLSPIRKMIVLSDYVAAEIRWLNMEM
ncbi:hypothetical protein VCR15J2_390071 [Vibrio coralliirubri]|uniref:hypothetical protein n=1 Tax=Vibrio coralliirubri TaxID=1516159 RepID=UPI000630618E|nr:hypothetical protein [Vibrio coralliirubri]CDT53437.1 hypothetical protein VCR15J2_390071 [Vibrio coralliirubri]